MSFFHSLVNKSTTRSHVLRVVEEPRPGARRGRVVRGVCGAWMFELASNGEQSTEFTETPAHPECGACRRTLDRRAS